MTRTAWKRAEDLAFKSLGRCLFSRRSSLRCRPLREKRRTFRAIQGPRGTDLRPRVGAASARRTCRRPWRGGGGARTIRGAPAASPRAVRGGVSCGAQIWPNRFFALARRGELGLPQHLALADKARGHGGIAAGVAAPRRQNQARGDSTSLPQRARFQIGRVACGCLFLPPRILAN